MASFDFVSTRKAFVSSVYKSLQSGHVTAVENCFLDVTGSDSEKKTTMDQAFRDVLSELIESQNQSYTDLINIATEAVKQEICSASSPFIMLSDLFESMTLDLCDSIFQYVEERVTMWKSETFYNSGKNYLLRMCNDLLRRLSKSQNTVFCGRIQLFLARLFPLSEKSGLNLMSQFNLENVTLYNTKPEDYDKNRRQSFEEKDENMDIEEGEMDDVTSSIPIDYNLYRKFWSLQDYFRKPGQCYDKVAWKSFSNYTDEVLGCFESFKLDDMKWLKKKLDIPDESHSYFAKYLTSEKLLDLQLSDSNFRRYVLVQFLILFQYLNAPIKFKNANQMLTDEQSALAKQLTERVYKIIRETPPEGELFAQAIEHILSREENWNNWKNEGCQSFVREKPQGSTKAKMPRKRSIGDDLKASGGKIIKMGNAELTRLWNVCPNNMQACRSEERNYVPVPEEFFEEAIEQSDPAAMIEEEYKLVGQDNFSWKALRLLARKSPHFFAQQQANNLMKKIPELLDVMIGKIAKEMPAPAEDVKTDVEEQETTEETTEDNLDKDQETNNKEEGPELVTKAQLETLASRLGAEWKTLATELNFPEDDIAFFESEATDAKEQALKMFTIWIENEAERATVAAMKMALKEIGEVAIATVIFGEDES